MTIIIYIYTYNNREKAALKSQVWGSLTLAQLASIYTSKRLYIANLTEFNDTLTLWVLQLSGWE